MIFLSVATQETQNEASFGIVFSIFCYISEVFVYYANFEIFEFSDIGQVRVLRPGKGLSPEAIRDVGCFGSMLG